MSKPVTLIIIGAGGRGTGYSNLVKGLNGRAKIVGVAEPRDFYRNRIANDHKVEQDKIFTTWEDVVKVPKFADAVVICTQDNMHVAPAV